MKLKTTLIFAITALIGISCSTETQNNAESTTEATPEIVATATPPKEWVEQRVDEAQKRLSKTEAGQLLWKTLEAHGGLNTWYSNGPLYYRFNYKNLKSGGPDTYQTINTWSAKARHQLASDGNIEYGWDGKNAWKNPGDAEVGTNPRFWALTPFYFVGVPFVIADQGITLKLMGDINFEDNDYHQILVTFKEGMGDAPDDFYVLYIDTETFKIGGLRYIVSYPGFFEDGKHSPEKHMTYYGEQTIDGITFPESIKTYVWDGKGPQEHTVSITISDMDFRPETLPGYFDVPEGATVLEGL